MDMRSQRPDLSTTNRGVDTMAEILFGVPMLSGPLLRLADQLAHIVRQVVQALGNGVHPASVVAGQEKDERRPSFFFMNNLSFRSLYGMNNPSCFMLFLYQIWKHL